MVGGDDPPGPGFDPDDPWAGIDLGQGFVDAAPVLEPSAEERLRRARATAVERRRHLQKQQLANARTARRYERRRARRRFWRSWLVLIVGGAALGGWLWSTANSEDNAGSGTDNAWSTAEDTFVHDRTISRFPPPPADAEDEPLGTHGLRDRHRDARRSADLRDAPTP